MKTFITLIILSTIISSNAFSQTGKLNKDTSGYSKSPLYVVKVDGDDREYHWIPLLSLIDQQDITNMEILKDKTADELYGAKGKNGVIIITLKQPKEILPLDNLFNQYKIKAADRGLPVFIDSVLTRPLSNNLFYTADKIKNVSIAKEKETGMKYISIITTNVKPKPSGEYRIRGGFDSLKK